MMAYYRKWRQMRGVDDSSYHSALVAVDRVHRYAGPISTVVDLGCGRGQWLAAFRGVLGCVVHGYDRKQYRSGWLAREEYTQLDLSRPYWFNATTASLAMSLEVAEHLPQQVAGMLVMNLCAIAPSVLFSAAIPGQGGLGHINEQPHSYWDALFARKGYYIATKFGHLHFPYSPWYTTNLRLYVRRPGCFPATT